MTISRLFNPESVDCENSFIDGKQEKAINQLSFNISEVMKKTKKRNKTKPKKPEWLLTKEEHFETISCVEVENPNQLQKSPKKQEAKTILSEVEAGR